MITFQTSLEFIVLVMMYPLPAGRWMEGIGLIRHQESRNLSMFSVTLLEKVPVS